MEVYNGQVAASGDDGTETPAGNVNIVASTSVMENTFEFWLARFTAVTIPPLAIIRSAKLSFWCPSGGKTGFFKVTLTAQKSTNAATITTANKNISSREVVKDSTGATQTLTANQYNEVAVDYRALIQEIVNLSGWASGNAMAVGFQTLTGQEAAKQFTINNFDASAEKAAKLQIEWEQRNPMVLA